MILSCHFLLGAVIATKIKFLPLAFLSAFLSHCFLDCVFHSEYSVKNISERLWRKSFFDFLKVALDLFSGIAFVFIFSRNLALGIFGGLFAVLPDGLTFLFLIFPKNKILEKIYNFHSKKIHYFKTKEIPLVWGIVSQILVFFIAIYFLRLP